MKIPSYLTFPLFSLFLAISSVGSSVFLSTAWAFDVVGKASLDPVEKPESLSYSVGTERHWLRDGDESITTVESVNADTYSAINSSGCGWTGVNYEFAPVLEWNNCYGSSGTQEIIKTKGSPWPLTEKSKFQYKVKGKLSDGGKPWTTTRKCKVKAMERVSVPAGEFDTFKIECKDKSNKRTYWYSPELSHNVALKRKHNTDSSRSFMMEFVKTVNP